MAGFLDQKERVMDTIITLEGRSQLARFGKLNPVYYSFSDAGVVYDVDTIVSSSTLSGLENDETYRPVFESTSLPQDTVAFEKNDSGFLNRETGQSLLAYYLWKVNLKNGEMFVTAIDGSISYPLATALSALAGEDNKLLLERYSDTLITSSFNSFKNLQIIKSPDPLSTENNEFKISPKTLNFDFSDTAPIENKNNQEADVNHIESLFWDKKFSHLPNYKFLPPVQRNELGSASLVAEDDYSDLSQNQILSFEDLKPELNKLEKLGSAKEIVFAETSTENNLFTQLFEYNNGVLSKLDIVDFGLFDDNGITKHIFFAGKLYQDGYNQSTFVNIFTFVFDLAET